jgi:hypothetical protein
LSALSELTKLTTRHLSALSALSDRQTQAKQMTTATDDPRARNGIATRWQSGKSGNPAGPKPGYRQAFSAGFLKDLAEVWQTEGRDALLRAAKTQPATFFAVCARLIPSDVKLTVEQSYGGLDVEDYKILQAIKGGDPKRR